MAHYRMGVLIGLLALGGEVWAAAPCQTAKFDNGPAHSRMADGARVDVQAFQCSRVALFNAVPGQDGQYLAYRIRWTAHSENAEAWLGDVGKDADGVVALKTQRVNARMLAVIEESERGGRLYLWQQEATPYTLDFMGDEDASLCLAAKNDGSVTVSHCIGKQWYGPHLSLRWLAEEGLWQAPPWQAIKAFNTAQRPRP